MAGGESGRCCMDVFRDGRQVFCGELVAELSLPGAEANRRRTCANGIPSRVLRLTDKSYLEGATA